MNPLYGAVGLLLFGVLALFLFGGEDESSATALPAYVEATETVLSEPGPEFRPRPTLREKLDARRCDDPVAIARGLPITGLVDDLTLDEIHGQCMARDFSPRARACQIKVCDAQRDNELSVRKQRHAALPAIPAQKFWDDCTVRAGVSAARCRMFAYIANIESPGFKPRGTGWGNPRASGLLGIMRTVHSALIRRTCGAVHNVSDSVCTFKVADALVSGRVAVGDPPYADWAPTRRHPNPTAAKAMQEPNRSTVERYFRNVRGFWNR